MANWKRGLFYERLLWFILFTITLSAVFGGIYYGLYVDGIDDFKIEDTDDIFNFWYFSWITQTTVGFGDMSPSSKTGKILVCAQVFLFWIGALSFAVLADENNMSDILTRGKFKGFDILNMKMYKK
jgi:hypothetical protein